jgi:hypothetical protein
MPALQRPTHTRHSLPGVTGDFEGDLTDEVSDFGAEQCAGLVRWRGFYFEVRGGNQVVTPGVASLMLGR